MSAEASESKTAAPTPAGNGGGNKLVLIITLVNLLVCLGIGAVVFISFKKEKDQAKVADISTSDEHGAAADHGGDGHGDKNAEGGHGEKSADAHGAKGGASAGSDYGKMIQLEQFTVNLSTPGGTQQKFVRVNISVEVPSEEVGTEVTSKMPQVRNAIIDLFNSKRPNDLATAEGRDFLKEEIRGALNSFMTSGKVKGVYFTNFAVTS